MQSTKQKRNSLGHFSISLWTYFQIINKTKFLIIQISSDLFFYYYLFFFSNRNTTYQKNHIIISFSFWFEISWLKSLIELFTSNITHLTIGHYFPLSLSLSHSTFSLSHSPKALSMSTWSLSPNFSNPLFFQKQITSFTLLSYFSLSLSLFFWPIFCWPSSSSSETPSLWPFHPSYKSPCPVVLDIIPWESERKRTKQKTIKQIKNPIAAVRCCWWWILSWWPQFNPPSPHPFFLHVTRSTDPPTCPPLVMFFYCYFSFSLGIVFHKSIFHTYKL